MSKELELWELTVVPGPTPVSYGWGEVVPDDCDDKVLVLTRIEPLESVAVIVVRLDCCVVLGIVVTTVDP